MASSNDTLDTLIVKATNPLVEKPDPADLASFCEKVTQEIDGPQIAVKLLAYRIHSPQEKEALKALSLLQLCVISCGPSFCSEIGKFRFLNELIKLVSPKYLAHRTSLPVKQKIIDILYTWTIDLKNEPKIYEAYDMLKKQGVIKDKPTYLGVNTVLPEAPVPKPRTPLFDDVEKDALLQKLLQSKNPEDLQAANRLIKTMVREEENRMEAASRRQLEIQTVNTSVGLLEELLENCEANGASAEDLDLCKELAANCDKLRPNLSKLAAETDDKTDSLGEILRTSDALSQVLERYERFINSPRTTPHVSNPVSGAALDLLGLDSIVQSHPPSYSTIDDQLLSIVDPAFPPAPSVNLLQPQKLEPSVQEVKIEKSANVSKPRGLDDLDVLGEALLKQNLATSTKLGSNFQKVPEKVPLNELAKLKAQHSEQLTASQNVSYMPPDLTEKRSTSSVVFGIETDFALLTQSPSLSGTSKSAPIQQTTQAPRVDSVDLLVPLPDPSIKVVTTPHMQAPIPDTDVSMLDYSSSSSEIISGTNDDVQLLYTPPTEKAQISAPSLADICLKFEEIKPSSKPPVNLLSQELGLTINLHSASALVPENVSVFVLSVTSKSSSPLTNFTFQAIVPKGNRVKLLPPSDNKLPSFNPFLPPPAITQVILLSTPALNLIELKYVVSYDMDGETTTEMGNIKELSLNLQ